MGDKQTKRQQQKAAKARKAKAQKRKQFLKDSLPMILIGALVLFVIGLAIWIIIDSIYAGKNNSTTTENTTAAIEESTEAQTLAVDYSACLTEEGLIENIKATDYVTLPDLSTISVALSDVQPSDEDVAAALESYMVTELVTDTDILVEDGDKINLDYVGYVDGVAFDGGNTQGAGTDLTIGSGSYIDDFEEQLIGYAPGAKVEVNVTFPENYGNEELNGKDALFNVTINGIYQTTTPTDEYVAEHYSDMGSTYAELEEAVINSLLEANVEEAAWNKMLEETEVKEFPEEYLANILETTLYMYQYEYDYYNEYMYSLNGEYQWDSVYDYYGVDETGYDEMINNDAYSQCKYYVVAQAVYEQYGLEVTENDLINCVVDRGYTANNLDNLIANYGSGYIYQSALGDVVREYVAGQVEVK